MQNLGARGFRHAKQPFFKAFTPFPTSISSQMKSPWWDKPVVEIWIDRNALQVHSSFGTYESESESSPCKAYCDNTVTISGHVFGKDHIGNFLFSYLAARTGFSFGATGLGAQLVATAQGKVDFPDDQAAYEAGYAHGKDPSGDFKAILESKNIDAMQNEAAKKGWPSTETATGATYPTWGATDGGLDNPD